uniref:ring-infected erythrocyte surface antigen-like n=1 Tax=Erigeron canadensis TaxID=72917 RepID=UPI001CB9546D|nr:ring-infected erythrocyte surface antigen-like [Erigeron canadensis]
MERPRWRKRQPDDEDDLNHIYDVYKDLFTIYVHYDELGYDGTDKDIIKMISYVPKFQEINVYVEHGSKQSIKETIVEQNVTEKAIPNVMNLEQNMNVEQNVEGYGSNVEENEADEEENETEEQENETDEKENEIEEQENEADEEENERAEQRKMIVRMVILNQRKKEMLGMMTMRRMSM